MTTRYLIAAALLVGSACGAQAEVVSGNQSGFLSGWTGGNGADVVSSGVLANGTSLVGGAAYGSGNLAETLYQKASANVGQSGAPVKLTYSQGIEGTYLLSTSNARLAAMLGNGMAVVSTSDGKVVTVGQSGSVTVGNGGGFGGGFGNGAIGGGAPGGGNASGGGSASNSGGASGGGTAVAGGGSTKGGGSTNAGNGVDGAPSGNYNNGNGATVITPAAGGQEGGAIVQLPIPAQNSHAGGSAGNGGGIGGIGGISDDVGVGLPAAPAAAVPEPSSIALMMAGMLGAMGIVRRRKR
ncbi:PEP-CTERM sorting domain-containing protein [Telluria sp. Tellsp131]